MAARTVQAPLAWGEVRDGLVYGAGTQPPQPARAQHVEVIDAFGAEHQCANQTHDLAPPVARPGAVAAQPDEISSDRLAPQLLRAHHPHLRDRALIIELPSARNGQERIARSARIGP